jgi:gliding motility-associated-like protein
MYQAAKAQQSRKYWYFGDEAGLRFDADGPKVLLDGVLYTPEGTAVATTYDGKLLFSTTGVVVFNRDHNPMPNGIGLNGDYSTTQSAIVVPHPGDDSLYYIFTAAAMENPGPGIQYSVVDMRADGGMGDVTIKNIPLHTPALEKLAAVRHANGRDYWIVSHAYGNNHFYAWLLNDTGLAVIPVTSKAGAIVNSPYGQMKFAPDGKKLACAGGFRHAQVFDFDRSTGVLSLDLTLSPVFGSSYGIEFAPSGRYLYTTTLFSHPRSPSRFLQFDLEAGDSAAVANSAFYIRVSSGMHDNYGGLQLGPDNRIYVVKYNSDCMDVVSKADQPHDSCGFFSCAVTLSGRTGFLGLPSFVSERPNRVAFSRFCLGDTTQFQAFTDGADSVVWLFGDNGNNIPSRATGLSVAHRYSRPGSFTLRALFYSGGSADTIVRSVAILPLPQIPFGRDTTICRGDSLQLDAGAGYATYRWQNGSTAQWLWVADTGTYHVAVSDHSCENRDTIRISHHPEPKLNLPDTVSVCDSDPVMLDVEIPGATYRWDDGSLLPRREIQQPGVYRVQVGHTCGVLEDSVVAITKLCACLLEMPDAFTPNGDGRNDVFGPVHPGCSFRKYRLTVYSRWGEKLFESTDPERGWHGDVKGNPTAEGVYVYLLHAVDAFGKLHQTSGTLTLLK